MLEATVQMILQSLVRLPIYGLWWLVFVGLVFSAARFTLWPFVYLAFVLVLCLIYHLEITTPRVNLSAEPDFFSMHMVIIRMVIVCAMFVLSLRRWRSSVIALRNETLSRARSNAHFIRTAGLCADTMVVNGRPEEIARIWYADAAPKRRRRN